MFTPAATSTSTGSFAAETIRVVADNVQSFSEMNALRKAVAGLHGVRSASVRPEGDGRLTILVVYEGIVPFAVRLNELLTHRSGPGFPAHISVREYELLPVRAAAA
ncbi:MAG: hypothetical protein CVU47_12040 [Chloroflexi bacterium HGW-Chloroflexi-9]|nr:MAG: hypothetical protein CVU47_12040 [Chloroflexi bacterium HGW-Chloroflexi-9]